MVWGLGHVGLVTAGGLLERGHAVFGIDRDADLIRRLVGRRSTGGNARLRAVLDEGLASGAFTVGSTPSRRPAHAGADFVCVNAATLAGGNQSVADVRDVLGSISAALVRRRPAPVGHPVVVRTTLLPGTAERLLVATLEDATTLRDGIHFDLLVNPSFVRHCDFEEDLVLATRVVIGASTPRAARRLTALYQVPPAALFTLDRKGAELAKYLDNAFHAAKVAFANEAAALARAVDTDPDLAMAVVAADRRPGSASMYLAPGGPYGGPCLPKDVRALATFIQQTGVTAPLLTTIEESNDVVIKRPKEALVAQAS